MCMESGTLPKQGINFGRMPFLTSPKTHDDLGGNQTWGCWVRIYHLISKPWLFLIICHCFASRKNENIDPPYWNQNPWTNYPKTCHSWLFWWHKMLHQIWYWYMVPKESVQGITGQMHEMGKELPNWYHHSSLLLFWCVMLPLQL